MDLPDNIVLVDLPGPKRGEYPALYFQDDVVWSPQRTHFALAYTICEASMCNDVGCILWARVDDNQATILQNPEGVHASCWQSPWCRWLSEDIFVFKAQKYNGKTTCVPLVAIHIVKGFQVLSGTNSTDKWLEDVSSINDQWLPFDAKTLLKKIGKCDMDNEKIFTMIMWFEYFDLWRINRQIRQMASEGYELTEVIPPGFPAPQGLSLKFSKTDSPKISRAYFSLFWRQVDFEYDWSFRETLGTFYISKEKGI